MVFELRAASGSSRGTLASVGHKLGINPETLRNWVEKAEIDSGQRPGTTSDDKKRMPSWSARTASCAVLMKS